MSSASTSDTPASSAPVRPAVKTVSPSVPSSGSDIVETRSKAVKMTNRDDAATTAHQEVTASASAAVAEISPPDAGTATTNDGTTAVPAIQRTPNSTALGTPNDPWPKPYYLERGLRRVEPYFYTYNTWVKERWRDRTIIDVFECEFRDRPTAYYRAAMLGGTVKVSGKTIGPDHVLRNGERISHTTHRHEPPVTSDPVIIIHEDEGMIVISKPAGVPVHPAGRYHYNSVVEIIKSERDPETFRLYPCNRLDRLTSGIMFLAKTPPEAKRLSLQIQARAVRKEYIARVTGRFPDGEVMCDQPVLQISPKLGLNRVRANGRSARTVFKRLAYYPPPSGGADASDDSKRHLRGSSNEGYSIVRCLPVTGRTHQIRVHLQYLGHPIENDPIYANQRVWGFDLGCGDSDASKNSDDDVISRLSRMGKEDVAEAVAYYDEMVDDYHKRNAEKISGELCPVCNTELYTDPGMHELSLWLHSLRYEACDGEWRYVSPLPAWALPPEGTSGPTNVGSLDELAGSVNLDAMYAEVEATERIERAEKMAAWKAGKNVTSPEKRFTKGDAPRKGPSAVEHAPESTPSELQSTKDNTKEAEVLATGPENGAEIKPVLESEPVDTETTADAQADATTATPAELQTRPGVELIPSPTETPAPVP